MDSQVKHRPQLLPGYFGKPELCSIKQIVSGLYAKFLDEIICFKKGLIDEWGNYLCVRACVRMSCACVCACVHMSSCASVLAFVHACICHQLSEKCKL